MKLLERIFSFVLKARATLRGSGQQVILLKAIAIVTGGD